MQTLQLAILYIHLLSAVIFVGGSFFMWIVIIPASKKIEREESDRNRIIVAIAKSFGPVAWYSLLILVITGLYNATWYAPNYSRIFSSINGELVLLKGVLTLLLIAGVYIHNVYYGRKISMLAKEKKVDELALVRRRSRLLSAFNLVLMLIILLVATVMQSY